MSTLAEALAKRPPRPARVVRLGVGSFVGSDAESEIAVGLRCLSHDEVLIASSEAAKAAVADGREGQEAVDRYNEELMLQAIGAAACGVNDARKPFFGAGAESARAALIPEAVRRLWDELELAHAACSPITPEASDEQLAQLADLLRSPEPLAQLSVPDVVRLRRWASVLIGLFRP